MTDDERDENRKTANPWANTRAITIVLITLAAVTIATALLR